MKLFIGFLLSLFLTSTVSASEPVNDCVIRNYTSQFVLNQNASLNVTEDLTVDCGNLPGKHGIFRILPTRAIRPSGQYPETKISQVRITDQNTNPVPFETSRDLFNHTLTWKIGDPDITISGVVYYRISYQVNNAVYTDNNQLVFNWNLNGHYWQLPIDSFTASVELPDSVKNSDFSVKLYDGFIGSESNTISRLSDDKLTVVSLGTLNIGEGITYYLTAPAGLITPYQPSFWTLYNVYLWQVLPIIALVIMFRLWRKKGDDPNLNAPDMVQYAPPLNLSPMEAGLLKSVGSFKNDYLTATIVDMAVRGYLKITELPKQIMSAKDYELTLLKTDITALKSYEQKILETLFSSFQANATTKISDQRNKFYTSLPEIKEAASGEMKLKKLIDYSSLNWKTALLILGGIGLPVGVWLAILGFVGLGVALLASAVIIFIFGLIMDRRTIEGAKAAWELDGFRVFIEKVEKYRIKFFEQENLFEKFLPYAVMFGLTSKWVKACQHLYTDANVTFPVAVWYVGTSSFSPSSFESAISSLSSQMGSALASSPSSSGGGGFSGGGGGGGGGGSW